MALVACENSHLSLPLGMFYSGADVHPERWLFCRLGLHNALHFNDYYSKRKFDPQRSNALICKVLHI